MTAKKATQNRGSVISLDSIHKLTSKLAADNRFRDDRIPNITLPLIKTTAQTPKENLHSKTRDFAFLMKR